MSMKQQTRYSASYIIILMYRSISFKLNLVLVPSDSLYVFGPRPHLRHMKDLQEHLKAVDKHYDVCSAAWAQGEADKFVGETLLVCTTHHARFPRFYDQAEKAMKDGTTAFCPKIVCAWSQVRRGAAKPQLRS